MASEILHKLQDAVFDALDYPRSLLYSETSDSVRSTLRDQLNYRAKNLFCVASTVPAESDANVSMWELYREDEGFHQLQVHNAAQLAQCLKRPIVQKQPDPRQRMFFIHAPNSRAQLSISQEMFLQILTYHNVMPTFLEYVFPFGKQHYARGFHLMGLHSENHLDEANKGLTIDALGRLGRHIELCYSLKSVESSSELPLRRSIRQCSVHHFLDLTTGQTTWIMIKANDLISKAVRKWSEDWHKTQLDSPERKLSPLALSLEIHGILVAWSGENWQWYISELESYLQEASRPTLSASLELPTLPKNQMATIDEESEKKPPTRIGSFNPFRAKSEKRPQPRIYSFNPIAQSNVLTTEESSVPPQIPEFDGFSFRDLQNVQFVEEKASEVRLVLESNSVILAELLSEYQKIATDASCADLLPVDFEAALSRFRGRVESTQRDMARQIARVDTLTGLVDGRKSLDENNAAWTRTAIVPKKTQQMANRMEAVTGRMEAITKEMQITNSKAIAETVSMRIITVVTLFFLPGTFMATVFSTPVINFSRTGFDSPGFSGENISVGALKLYLIASLPLLILTMLGWWFMTFNERRQLERRARKRMDMESGEDSLAASRSRDE